MSTANKVRVMAVSGRMLPSLERLKGFTGYALANDGGDADHEVPDGNRYRIAPGGEEVPNNAYYRRALSRGDIANYVGTRKSIQKDEG